MWRMRLWLCVAASALVARASPPPGAPAEDECVGSDGDEVEYRCNGGQYELRGTRYQYVNIVCQGNELNCSTFPRKSFSKNSILEMVSFRNCALDGPISCLLHKMDAVDVKKITLRDFLTPLTREHFEGLEAVTKLRVYDKGVQNSIPYEAIASLPNLVEFRLNGGHVAIKPRQFQGPSLGFLELSSDSIGELRPLSFVGLPNLDYLGLWGNNVTVLHNDTFQGLEKLQSLVLSTNSISSLEVGGLSPLVGLGELTIKKNPLAHLRDGVFQGLDRLKNITISSTEPLQLGPSAFSNLASLRNLVLESCLIEDLPATVFRGSESIEILSLTDNQLEYLSPALFKDQARMKELNLSKNKLKEVTDELFMPLKKLVELDLSHNLIETFPDYLFSALTKLQTLSAANNRLKHIGQTTFQGVALRTLNLANNMLYFSPEDFSGGYGWDPCPFNGLQGLRTLILRNNTVDAICEYWRVVMTQLDKLDLSYNRFTELTTADFSFTSAHLTMDLSHNNISTVILNPVEWSLLAPTVTVKLNHNPFNCDCYMYSFVKMATSAKYSRYFPVNGANCTSPIRLRGINLGKVPLDRFVCGDDNCPSGCDCVNIPARNIMEIHCSNLNLQRTNITETVSLKLNHAPITLDRLPFENVIEVDLSGLNLTEISYDNLPKSVKLLNLSNNQLEYLPSKLLRRNLQFALSNNSLACDCWHYEHIAKLLRNVSKIKDFESVKCADGTPLSLIDAKRLCDVWLASSIGVSLTVIGILCIVFAAIVYRYSFEVKIYVSKYLPCVLPEEKYDASKKYDVFISYAHQDEDFVRDELLAKLEGSPNNLKTCVHFRDWLAGETIPYNIAKSVEDSRRTIIVLSENFLGSIWGLLEFRAAHVQATREGRARVVIILLQDVTNKKELDREISAYLHTNTYIKWGEPWFWEKLAYALPKREKIVDRGEEKRLHSVAQKLVTSGLDVKLNSDGKLVNAAFIKDI